MTERKWTPGPWWWDGESSDNGGTWLWSDVGPVVDYAGCGSHDTDATQHDRNLIAAAPDLYDALDTIYQNCVATDETRDWLACARDALARARGE